MKVFWLTVVCLCMSTAHATESWPPVSAEELQMKAEPKAPGAPAVILDREVDRNDWVSTESNYLRVKVLTEEGRNYANVKIPFFKGIETIDDIQARVIQPDGHSSEFNGSVYEEPAGVVRGFKTMAKAFVLPDVQVGSIIEYRYRDKRNPNLVYGSNWILSSTLFTKHAQFSLRANRGLNLRYIWPNGLPAGTSPPAETNGVIHLETHDVPAFVVEEFMPPEEELKLRVEFIYSYGEPAKDPNVFWTQYAHVLYRRTDGFLDDRRAMRAALATIVQPQDSNEVKLRKIYARVQQLQNDSYQSRSSEEARQGDQAKRAHSVADVWNDGYGYGWQLTLLFLALVRAADIPADAIELSTRNKYFFDLSLMNTAQLNGNAVVVTLDGKDLYLDPGAAYTPFGLLPWWETGVKGLRLVNADGEATWISTPLPAPSDSRVERRATLQLTSSGILQGKLTVTFTGLEAQWRRLEERNEDDAARRKYLEDLLKADVPNDSDIVLTNQPDWSSSDAALIAEYDLSVPGWAAPAGHRLLMPIGLFTEGDRHRFVHALRTQPLYFAFPYQQQDDLSIALPPGWQVTNLPPGATADLQVANYSLKVESEAAALHVRREFNSNMVLLKAKYYEQLRDFYQSVRSGDEQQVVLSSEQSAARQ